MKPVPFGRTSTLPAALGACFAVLVFAGASRAAVTINEIVTANQSGLKDEDGAYTDWLELYNSAATPVELAGYRLSDGAGAGDEWILPRVQLAAHGFEIVHASGKDRRSWAKYWSTPIASGETVAYFVGSVEPPTAWNEATFNDQPWPRGSSGLGFGDGDDGTIVPQVLSVYLRARFQIADLANLSAAVLHVDYDDGFVAYLNGVEIARSHLGEPGSRPAHDTPASSLHEAVLYQGGTPERWLVDPALVRAGDNVLAVEVHNVSIDSSDLSITPFLTLGFVNPPQGGIETPPEFFGATVPRLHASFRLATSETVRLLSPGGSVLDEVSVGQLYTDSSLGRVPDGAASFRFFVAPTPRAPNAGASYAGFADSPTFSVPGGPQSGTVTVSLSSPSPSAIIRFTLDDTDPGETSALYTAPLALAGTSVLRARAFETGKIPSPIASRTYLSEPATTLPIVSLVTDPANLWDPETGIYVFGDSYDPEYPYFGANFWEDWERPVHVELFEPGGTAAIDQEAGIQIHGGWSRGRAQKSFRIAARSGYGAPSFEHHLFAEKDIASFENFLLRNSGNDWSVTHFRDALMQRATAPTSLDRQAYRPATVYVNGTYWGILNLRERIDEHYLASNHDVDPDDLDIVENWHLAIAGDLTRFDALQSYLQAFGAAGADDYAYVEGQMDTQNFADYLAFEIYYANTDWPGNNVRCWRERTSAGRWRWILYDTDFGLGLHAEPDHNTLAFALEEHGPDWPNPSWSTFFFRTLLENPSWKRMFVNRYADLMNTALSPATLLGLSSGMENAIANEIPRHMTRWGFPPEAWQTEVQRLRAFIAARPAYAREHVLEELGLDGLYELALSIEPPQGGSIRLAAISASNGFVGTYFEGNPVTLTAVPRPGYRFVRWSDGSLGTGATVTIDPSSNYAVTAVFEPAPATIVINEITYNPPPAFDSEDWVELHNPTSAPIDVSGWTFKDGDDAHAFQLPSGAHVDAGGYLVVCRSLPAFTALFPGVGNVIGSFGFGLDGAGELIRLFDGGGALVDSVRYDDNPPWPTEPDGDGPSLELVDADLDNALASSWSASAAPHGTPGAANSVTSPLSTDEVARPPDLVLAPAAPNPFNPTTRLRIGVPSRGRASLGIFDVAGREVARLVDGVLDPGWYELTWNARRAASGVYFARLRAGSDERVQKLLLTK